MRLIDADAWWEEVQKLYTDGDCADKDRYKLGVNVGITASRGVMFHLPTIDAVSVVRCKECKKANTEDCSHSYWDDDWGEWRVGYNGDDWFCADGEREGE